MPTSLCSCCDNGMCQRGRIVVGYTVSLLGLELCHRSWHGWRRHSCSLLERQITLLPKPFPRKQTPDSRRHLAVCVKCLCTDTGT